MLAVHDLPTVNAVLNGTAACLLALGYRFIRRGDMSAHRNCMLAAFGVSTLFLVSYLTYHYQVGSVHFTGTGWVRGVYFAVLVSHTILAAQVPPLAVVTLSRALRGRFDRHRRLARWTLPVWFYVSLTGVVVYVMLYRLYPA
ncbi:MAG: DUF420 domain-containing protein [Candidatus Binatia bacterium]